MNIYYLIYIIFAFFSFIELWSKQDNRVVALLGYVLVLIMGAIRWKTGTDWDEYYYFFASNHTLKDYVESDAAMEVGYRLLNFVARCIYPSFSILLMIATTFSVYTYANYCRASGFNRYPATLLLLFWCIMPFGGIFFTRQIIANMICILSLQYVIRGQLTKFLAVVAIACTFHISAVIYLVSYFIYKQEFTKEKAIFALLAFCIGGGFIGLFINMLIESYSGYIITKLIIYSGEEYEMEQSSLVMGTIKRLLTLPLFVLYRKNIQEDKEMYDGCLNLYIFGTCVYYLFALGNLGQLVRMSVYFQFFELPLFYIILRHTKNIVLIFYIMAYCGMKVYSALSGYPDLYVPFETVFDSTYKQTY